MSCSSQSEDSVYAACLNSLLELGLDEEVASVFAAEYTEMNSQPAVDVRVLLTMLGENKKSNDLLGYETLNYSVTVAFQSPQTIYSTFYVSERDTGPDFTIVRQFYEALWALEDKQLEESIIQSLNRLFNPFVIMDNNSIFVWLVCLFCPIFSNPNYMELLDKGLAPVQDLDVDDRLQIELLMGTFGYEEMHQMLSMLHTFLTMACLEESFDSSSLSLALDMMSLLYEANQYSHVISHAEFYNPSFIGQDFNLDSDTDSFFQFSFLNYPFLFDSNIKSKFMRQKNKRKQEKAEEIAKARDENITFPLKIVVDRQDIVSDAFGCVAQLKKLNVLRCSFIVQFNGENGIDQGGLTKEFFNVVFHKLFDEDYGMFHYDNESHFWWFRSSNGVDLKREFNFLGTLMGLAVLNGHLLNLCFPTIFYKKLLGHDVTIEDLRDIFPDIYANLKQLLEMDTDVSSLGLYFTVDDDTGLGAVEQINLISNGDRIEVNNDNKSEYVTLYAKHLVETKIKRNFDELKKGFFSVCIHEHFKTFHPVELEEAICGSIITDITNLEQHVIYRGFQASDSLIQWLWAIVKTYNEDKKRRFLAFVTGSDRSPIGGFQDLNPSFQVRKGTLSTSLLPVASTCFNTLVLPPYQSRQTLESRLDTALEHCEGFGMA